jgi:hypothetical protein
VTGATISTSAGGSVSTIHSGVGKKVYAVRPAFLGFLALLALAGAFTANGLITAAALALVPILIALLWRNGEPPVLLLACLFQWLQATAAIFYTNELHVTLEEAFGSNRLAIASWLSIGAVLALAFGIRFAFTGASASQSTIIEAEAAQIDVRKVANVYFLSAAVSTFLGIFAWRLPSVSQPILAVASMKWATIFLLFYVVLQQRRGYGFLAACLGLEFALGTLGLFADFKCVFVVLLVVAMSSTRALRGQRLAAILGCFAVLFVLGVVWTSIKTDYREFLNEGAESDEAVPIERKFSKLTDLVETVTWENLTDGFDALILRVSYVNFFALTIENVPNRVPFENGELWKEAVIHVLTPRLLFPDKLALDDSERTRLYTGVNVAGAESGTSIGIGYVGESYVDFGEGLMFTPIFVMGIIYGLIDRLFISRARHKILGSAFAVAILLFNAYAIETSNIKLLGGVIVSVLAGILIYKLFANTLMTYIQAARPRRSNLFAASLPEL